MYIQDEFKGILPEPIVCGAEVGKGWVSIVIELHNELVKLDPDYTIDQVKEKFGGLRFYANHDCNCPPHIGWECDFHKAIARAERKSYKICEQCGEPGVLRKGSWVLTLCDKHANGKEPNEDWLL